MNPMPRQEAHDWSAWSLPLTEAGYFMVASDGGGYWVAAANGAVYTFGDAENDGSVAGQHLNGSIIAATGW